MIQKTRWTPDTCSIPACIIDYSWDDATPPESRVHRLAAFVQKCKLHDAMTDDDAYSAVTDENPRKNKFLAYLEINVPSLFITTSSGTVPIPGAIILAYDKNRVLQATLAVDAGTKPNLQSNVNTLFGSGKITIL